MTLCVRYEVMAHVGLRDADLTWTNCLLAAVDLELDGAVEALVHFKAVGMNVLRQWRHGG